MNQDLQKRWLELIARLEHRDGDSEELFDALNEFQAQLQDELFGANGLPEDRRVDIDPQDSKLQLVLDALATLALLAPDDPAYPWERGGLLSAFDRNLEAAEDYLTAARLFVLDAAAGTGTTGDEHDWAKAALFHAATNLALGGHPTAAAALLPQLEPDDRSEVEPLIGAKTSETIL